MLKFFCLYFFRPTLFFKARLNNKKSIFRIFFYFTVPPTPQKRPEDGMSTIVPRISSPQRKSSCRCTLNAENIETSLKRIGYKNVQTVILEDLTFREQMITAYCSDVLFAVQGAALIWYVPIALAPNLPIP